LFELAPEGILIADSAGRLTDANEASCELLGFSRAELVGKTIVDLLPRADEFSEALALLSAGKAQVSRGQLRHKNGHFVRVEASAKTLPDGRLVALIRDLSHQKGAADSCRFGGEHCRALFENSMDAVLLTAPDGRIAMVNPAAVAMFGFTAEELRTIGRSAVIDTTDPQTIAALEERRRTGQFRGELMFKRKDGTRFPAEISSAIFRDESGAEWTSMFIRDVSERTWPTC
jgi:PAS domain S-box-containing protein